MKASPSPVTIRYYRNFDGQLNAHVESHNPLPYGWIDFVLVKNGLETVVSRTDNGEEFLRSPLPIGEVQKLLPRLLSLCSMSYLAGDRDGTERQGAVE